MYWQYLYTYIVPIIFRIPPHTTKIYLSYLHVCMHHLVILYLLTRWKMNKKYFKIKKEINTF